MTKEEATLAPTAAIRDAAKVLVWSHGQLLMEVRKGANPLDPWVANTPVKTRLSYAAVEPAEAARKAAAPVEPSMSSHPMRPGHGRRKSHEDSSRKENNKPKDAPVFHGSTLRWVCVWHGEGSSDVRQLGLK